MALLASRRSLVAALNRSRLALPILLDNSRTGQVVSTRFLTRLKSSRSGGYSPLNDPSPNWSNRPPKETILLDGCDYEHWLIVMEFSDDNKPSEDQMIDSYIKTLAAVLGSEEEAKKKIYSVCTTTYTGFGALMSEELSYKIKEQPGVLWVLPDSYLDVPNKDYGGDLFVDGKVIHRPQYRFNDRNQTRPRPRPRHDRRRETMLSERRDTEFRPTTALNQQHSVQPPTPTAAPAEPHSSGMSNSLNQVNHA